MTWKTPPMIHTLKTTCIAISLLVTQQAGAAQQEPAPYMVSGLLQTTGTTIVKLVQAVEVAESKDHAIRLFRAQATNQYPGRALIDVIVESVPTQAKSCGISI